MRRINPHARQGPNEAEAITARGKADADVIGYENQADAAGWKRAVEAFNGNVFERTVRVGLHAVVGEVRDVVEVGDEPQHARRLVVDLGRGDARTRDAVPAGVDDVALDGHDDRARLRCLAWWRRIQVTRRSLLNTGRRSSTSSG